MIIRTEISMLTVSGIQLHGGHGHPCSIRFHPIQDLYCLRRHVGLFLLFLTTRKIAKSTLHSNAFMIPVVYFFYPETAYRSLEEMDSIFRKCNSYFTVVKVARDEPRRYDKHGKPLVNYEETEEHRRRASAWSNPAEKAQVAAVENRDHADPGYKAENGSGGDIDAEVQ